jgi:hypothetical protein
MRAFLLTLVFTGLHVGAFGQVISLRTIPGAAAGEQSVPGSRSIAMGGAMIALVDTVGDPVHHPARGMIMDRRFMAAGAGLSRMDLDFAGRLNRSLSVPLAVMARGDRIYGGILASWQEEERPRGVCNSYGDPRPCTRRHRNGHLTAMGGIQWSPLIALGLSMQRESLGSFPPATVIHPPRLESQDGTRWQIKGGVMMEIAPDHELDVTLTVSSLEMTHRRVMHHSGPWWPTTSIHEDVDERFTYGLVGRYAYPVEPHWRAGILVAVEHHRFDEMPSFGHPVYAPESGFATVANIGVGSVARFSGVTLTADAIYEPARIDVRHPESPTSAQRHRYRLQNTILASGVEIARGAFDLHGGLRARTHRVDFGSQPYQSSRPMDMKRRRDWTEWTLTGGATLRFDQFFLRYTGQRISGMESWPDWSGWHDYYPVRTNHSEAAPATVVFPHWVEGQATTVVEHRFALVVPF